VIKTKAMASCKLLFRLLAVPLVALATVRSGTAAADAPSTGSPPCCWPLETIHLCLLIKLQKRNRSACCSLPYLCSIS
jgi:hypothetical protein